MTKSTRVSVDSFETNENRLLDDVQDACEEKGARFNSIESLP